jgi:hypothetical protein
MKAMGANKDATAFSLYVEFKRAELTKKTRQPKGHTRHGGGASIIEKHGYHEAKCKDVHEEQKVKHDQQEEACVREQFQRRTRCGKKGDHYVLRDKRDEPRED